MDMENSNMYSRECSGCLQRPSNTYRFSWTGAKSEYNANLHVPQSAPVASNWEESSHWPADTHAMDMERSVVEDQSDTENNLQQQVSNSHGNERVGFNHLDEDMHAVEEEYHHELEPETTVVTVPTDKQRKKGVLMCLSATKIVALVILGIVIAGLFSVPITLFVLNSSDSSVTATECNTYTGEICQTALLARQSCIPGREDSTEVSVALTSSLQTVVERQFALLPMSDTPNSTCERELLSFLCVEAFAGLCDDNGTVHRTTRRECERVTSTVCAAEFLPQLKANGFALSCDTFPTSSSICTTTTNKVVEMEESGYDILIPDQASNGTSTMGVALDRNCSEGFFMDETSDLGLCKPVCGEWWPLSNSQVEVLNIVTLTSGALGATLCLVVVILSIIHYRTTFSFPGIFIFYQMLSSLVYVIVFLIDYVDFKALLCGSSDLLESLMPGNETPMCIISAAAWIYISHQVALWWIFHLSVVFCGIFWPFKYHYLKELGYFRHIHFVMVLAALVLPIIPVIICYRVDGYVLYFLIRPDCVARNVEAAFYSHIVPLLAAVAIGLYLLVLIFWKFFSEEWMCSKKQDFTKRQVEIKILLLLCCYVLIWADVIGVSVATLIEAEDYLNTLTEYFTCEAAGVEGCPKGAFESFGVVSKTIAYALIGLYPAIFLVYFVSVKNTCRNSRTTINSTGTSASVLSRNIS